jgi:hypothetical protein
VSIGSERPLNERLVNKLPVVSTIGATQPVTVATERASFGLTGRILTELWRAVGDGRHRLR